MTSSDDSGSGPSGSPNPSGPEPSDSSSAPLFTDLGGPLGPLEAVERLRILETLSYGVLYEGRVFQASRSEPISLLEVDPAFEQDPQIFGRLIAELLVSARLREPGILSPRGVFRHGESLYVLHDAQTGVSLATAFEFLGRSGLRLSSEAILRVAGSVLAALDATPRESEEQDAYHGLLTPENVFVAEGQQVLVRGLGFWPAGINRTGLLGLNERRYLAPSQNRSGVASPRTDLLSLGMILFEAVLGFPAFDAPPEEEDLAELRASAEELKEKADPSLADLFEMVLACLSPPASTPSSYRGRLRTTIDTLFLREFSRDRGAKTLSLEELVGRIKTRRPAIVRATSLSLAPAHVESGVPPVAEEPAEPITLKPAEPGTSPSPVRPPPFAPERPERPSSAAMRTLSLNSRLGQGGRRVSGTVWLFAGAAVALGALVAIFWSAFPRSEHMPGEVPTAVPEERIAPRPTPPLPQESLPATAPLATASQLPTVLPEPSPRPAPTSAPTDRAVRLPSATAPSVRRAPRTRAPAPAPDASSEEGKRLSVQTIVGQSPGEVSQPMEAAAAVPPGSLVPLGTPGLRPPVLLEKPPMLRYGEADPHLSVERSVILEILVTDQGRVRGSRILRADRLPPSGGLERYLAALRFRPAELGGVPVRVWMPYEVQFLAP